jgi:beta-N-acetylhexosaminidase
MLYLAVAVSHPCDRKKSQGWGTEMVQDQTVRDLERGFCGILGVGMKMALRQAAGSLLVAGLAEKELTGMERAWLKLVQPAGMILFQRNIANARQTRALVSEAAEYCLPHCASFVDVEGGTVNRLKEVLAPIAPAQAVAQAARRRPGLAREHGELIARAVKAFGLNTSLAPMVDLALPDSAEVLGTRCPAATAAETIAYARDFMAGMAAQGVAGCGKHFPGLGGGTRDSHLETPKIRRSWPQLWQEDLEPYRALHRAMPIIMVNHAAYPQTAGKTRPASVSNFWIQTVLRKRIGYRGMILSDDLEMGGVARFMPIEEAGIEAVRAGADLVLICHHAEPILRVYEALIAEGERSAVFGKVLLERARTSARKRVKVLPAKMQAALSARQFEALRARILRFNETIESIVPRDLQAAAQKTPTLVETA